MQLHRTDELLLRGSSHYSNCRNVEAESEIEKLKANADVSENLFVICFFPSGVGMFPFFTYNEK